MVTNGVEHISYAPKLSLSASCSAALQSSNKSYVSNEAGCLAEEHSRCLKFFTFGVEHISCEPELSQWASHAAASQSTVTGIFLTRRNNFPEDDTLLSRFLVRSSSFCYFAPFQT